MITFPTNIILEDGDHWDLKVVNLQFTGLVPHLTPLTPLLTPVVSQIQFYP
jgi:hypothetical protein